MNMDVCWLKNLSSSTKALYFVFPSVYVSTAATRKGKRRIFVLWYGHIILCVLCLLGCRQTALFSGGYLFFLGTRFFFSPKIFSGLYIPSSDGTLVKCHLQIFLCMTTLSPAKNWGELNVICDMFQKKLLRTLSNVTVHIVHDHRWCLRCYLHLCWVTTENSICVKKHVILKVAGETWNGTRCAYNDFICWNVDWIRILRTR